MTDGKILAYLNLKKDKKIDRSIIKIQSLRKKPK